MFIKDKNNDNSKKMLCFNMLNKQKCNYGNKCMYAHSLSEQQIEPLRHKVYTIIKCTTDLSHMDLINDYQLYETILQLTRICSTCIKGACPGGYNCKNGTFNIKCKICFEDLVYGNCKRTNCQSVHLTDRGLVPYIKQKNKDKFNNIKKINNKEGFDKKEDVERRDDFERKPKFRNNDFDKITKLKKELDEVKGVLLTENFLITHLGKNLNNLELSDSENDEDTAAMIKFFDSPNENSDDDSIFLI